MTDTFERLKTERVTPNGCLVGLLSGRRSSAKACGAQMGSGSFSAEPGS